MLVSLVSSLVAVILSVVILFVAWCLSERGFADREKSSAFECGFDPAGSARIPFSLRFFLLAVIFLIFDVEIVLLFPAVTKLVFSLSFSLWISIFLFLIILMVGLFHEWNEGSLDWMG
uniref:NADH-ubiquinone oxidoreductase chain 3 n=1 Tax=Anatoma sp. MNHN-IM-2013-42003 TaxID=2496594 RepID=A0A6B7FLS9_9VEST|nr:NADH dehydrogenase subunit 3 [Anatoma sp. MNHN-IM-2013-42003]